MFANREMLGITNICLLLNHMIVISPSNAHTERQIKFMNNIKTLHRTSLGQNKLNNQFKIAGNSKIGKDFNPQPFVDHYVKKSIQAKDAEQKIVLSCGQEVPIQKIMSSEKQLLHLRLLPKLHLQPQLLFDPHFHHMTSPPTGPKRVHLSLQLSFHHMKQFLIQAPRY